MTVPCAVRASLTLLTKTDCLLLSLASRLDGILENQNHGIVSNFASMCGRIKFPRDVGKQLGRCVRRKLADTSNAHCLKKGWIDWESKIGYVLA